MEYALWQATEAAIRHQFGYDAAADRAAAHELHALVPTTNRLRELGVLVRNRTNLTILGAGPSLAGTVPATLAGRILIAADGAAGWLRENGLVPDLVVTDLDGNPDDLAWAARRGAAMVVHAHGDNRPQLAQLAPHLLPRLYGTHQGPPEPALAPMANVGGFTDGDRAVVLCEHLGARAATLHGFDFNSPPGPYSHRWDPATKPAKLAWAERIVSEVHARGDLRLTLWRP